MNILKILGVVVAVHVVAFFLMFVNPGCRSTSQKPTPVVSDTTSMAPAGGTSDFAPAPAPAVSVDLSPPPVVRYSPTRPNTPAADALESAPPANVTPATTYTVVAGDSLWKIAKRNGTTVAELAKANRMSSNSQLTVGQKLIIPGKAPAAEVGEAATAAGAGATYVVKPGDTLSGIARRLGTTSAEIKRVNNLNSDYVRVGQELRLPTEGGSALMAPSAAPAAVPQAAPTKKADGSVVHVVKAGETIGAIARKYQVKAQDLLVANNISDPRKIRPGQELVIPGYTAPAVTTPGAAAGAPAAATTSAPAATPEAPAPPPGQDLDSGLKPQDNVPVIKIEGGEDQPPKSP